MLGAGGSSFGWRVYVLALNEVRHPEEYGWTFLPDHVYEHRPMHDLNDHRQNLGHDVVPASDYLLGQAALGVAAMIVAAPSAGHSVTLCTKFGKVSMNFLRQWRKRLEVMILEPV